MDIVERLRSVTRLLRETKDYTFTPDDTLADEAADEIERLREELRKAGAAVERLAFKMPPPNMWTPQFVQLGQQIARSALQQKESE